MKIYNSIWILIGLLLTLLVGSYSYELMLSAMIGILLFGIYNLYTNKNEVYAYFHFIHVIIQIRISILKKRVINEYVTRKRQFDMYILKIKRIIKKFINETFKNK